MDPHASADHGNGVPRAAGQGTPRFDVTVDRAPVGIAHFDHTGRFQYANPRLCAIFGVSRDELVRKTFHEISFPDELPRCLLMTEQLAAGTIPRYTLEKRFTRPDGSFVYVRVIVTIVRDIANTAPFFVGVVEDLSEQWAAEEARRAAEERLAMALEASGTGIYRYDFQAQALEWSNGLARIFGFSDGDKPNSLERMLSAIHPDDLPTVLAAYDRCVRDGSDFDEEFRVVLGDGSVRWLSDRARVTRDAQGRTRFLTGACVDITKRREAEEARGQLLERERAARGEAEQAIELRDQVLAVVAHDLRNPVHTILMAAGAAIDLPLAPQEHALQLSLIRRSARGIDTLIRDLLDATQIELGRLAIHVDSTTAERVVEDTLMATSAMATERGVDLRTEVSAGLPGIRADRARIVQALGNLVGNAIKFTPRGGRVVIGARPAGGLVELSVSDTGSGIAAEHLPRIFDRYWQADPKAHRGVGLGLAIVRGIIEAHGGSVDVESQVGEGTTFRFTLPAGS